MLQQIRSMPLEPTPGLPRPVDPCAGELLALYASACHDGLATFERRAARLLGGLVGFDGAVWGRGAPAGGGVRIDTATVLDRDERLLGDYAACAVADPVAAGFFACPSRTQQVDVASFYRGAGLGRIGECLVAHDVAHLLLGGGIRPGASSAPPTFSWITAYRDAFDKPFGPAEASRYAALLPHWVQAREVCAELARARAPAPPAPSAEPDEDDRRPRSAGALSPREAEVLVLVSRGCTYVEVATLMGLARATVYSHVRSVYEKLGVHSKTEAVFEARALGWLD